MMKAPTRLTPRIAHGISPGWAGIARPIRYRVVPPSMPPANTAT